MSEPLCERAASHPNKAVVHWFESALRVHDKQIVADLLTKNPQIVEADLGSTTALHLAARYGHDQIATHLLSQSLDMANATDTKDWTPLHWAASLGHEQVVAMLLALNLNVAAKDKVGNTPLLYAVQAGHDKVVAQMLAANCFNSLDHVDCFGWTALHNAAFYDRETCAEMLLAVAPEQSYALSKRLDTALHLWSNSGSRNKRFFATLLASNPAALRAVNNSGHTPFDTAVFNGDDLVIDVVQWELTFDEVVNTFITHQKSYKERLAPIVERQCECLVESLNQDVVGTVFAYLGFDLAKRLKKRKAFDTASQ